MQDNSTLPWYTDPQWWIVIVAFTASIVALFQDILHKWILKLVYHPRINADLRLRPGSPDSQKIPFIDRCTGKKLCDSYYLRFWVQNGGNYRLEDTEAMVTEVSEKAPNGEYREKENFLPLNLLWAHNDVVSMPKIQPRLHKHLNFGYITKSEFANLDHLGIGTRPNILFKFCFGIEPTHGSHILLPGDYRITIVFASTNLSPIIKRYNFVIADKWDDNEQAMLQNNISMKPI